MSVESVVSRRLEELTRVGKVGLNMLYPNEFELYIIALELVDYKGNTEQYFIFPVNPNSIEQTHTPLTNIKKTLGGIVVLSNNTENPLDIPISGTFGRKFRVLLGKNDYQSIFSSFQTRNEKQEFDIRTKTGFGCCKILEDIINKSDKLDENGRPRTLILHNLAFSSTFVVKCTNLRFTQTQDMNMLWSYTLNLKTIANLSQLRLNVNKSKNLVLSNSLVQTRVNESLTQLTNLL